MTTKTATKKQETTEVATMAQGTVVAVSTIDIAEDRGNDFTTKDLSIPFLRILQAMSPQVKKREGSYVQGAEPGMFYNTATGALYSGETGVLFVPAHYERRITQWKPRGAGGGLVRDHGSNEAILAQSQRNDKGKEVLSNGDELVTSGMYYGFILDGNDCTPAVLSLNGTQLKKARKWNNVIDALRVSDPKNPSGRFNPAMFYSTFLLTTVSESNDKGSWFGVSVARHGNTLDLPNGQDIYLQARDLRKSVKEGAVRAAVDTPEAALEVVAAHDDEVPF
jgi:hypothetical protein